MGNPEFKRLSQILSRVVEGEQTADEERELNSLLEKSDEYCKYYLEYLDLNTILVERRGVGLPESSLDVQQLCREIRSMRSVTAAPKIVSKKGLFSSDLFSGASSWGAPFFLISAALLFALNLYFLSQLTSGEKRAAQLSVVHPVSDENTPQLIGMTACVWHSEMTPALGKSFGLGELVELREGIAEFQVRNSLGETSKVLVEGPANVFVRSDGQLGLRRGRLIADANQSQGEFRIDIPGGFVDFSGNASVGIDSKIADTEVHAFKGIARLRRGFGYGHHVEELEIETGASAKFTSLPDGETSVMMSQADESMFASTRTMSFDQLNLNDAYRELVVQSEPSIYWRFEGGDAVNEMSDKFVANLRGSVNQNRYKGNVSPEFGNSSDRGSFITSELWPEEPLDEYTVELWAKPSHYHNGAMIGFCVPDSKKHGLMVEIGAPYHSFDFHTRPNRFRFLHRSPPGGSHGVSCYADDAYQVRTWQHVVARKKGDMLELLVDGILVSQSTEERPLPADLQIVIGQLYLNMVERPFFGQIDEVALYERALTDEEIELHYNAARSEDLESKPVVDPREM